MNTASNHEASPACALVATRCVCCSRKLTDALSVQLGIGPDCRETYGYNAEMAPGSADWTKAWELIDPMHLVTLERLHEEGTSDARKVCNVLVHHAAIADKADRGPFVFAIRALGYTKLADKIQRQAGRALARTLAPAPVAAPVMVLIRQEGDTYHLRCPYSEAFNAALRANHCQAWFVRDIDPAKRHWCIPVRNRKALWTAIKSAFAGGTLVSSKGAATIS